MNKNKDRYIWMRVSKDVYKSVSLNHTFLPSKSKNMYYFHMGEVLYLIIKGEDGANKNIKQSFIALQIEKATATKLLPHRRILGSLILCFSIIKFSSKGFATGQEHLQTAHHKAIQLKHYY